jgi:acetyl-CoA carboxylase biotin carboxyl carrier protein
MDIRNIEKLVKIFDSSSLTELSIEEEGLNIYLSRNNEVIAAPAQHVAYATPQPAIAPEKPLSSNPAATEAAPKPVDGHQICSPIVGTYYSAPSPDSDPYVSVGAKVKVGQTLCIIEAMKVMNEIEADKAGVIAEILVENGQAVEYNQPLFVIKPE